MKIRDLPLRRAESSSSHNSLSIQFLGLKFIMCVDCASSFLRSTHLSDLEKQRESYGDLKFGRQGRS